MKYCIDCGAPLDNDSQFCSNCGKKINICPRCGTVLKDDSLFCARCGTRLDTQKEPYVNPQQLVPPVISLQEKTDIVDEWEEEKNKNWRYLIGSIAVIVLLIASWLGYTQFYKFTHIDVHGLLSELQLPKDYYHSAKDIVNKPNFDLNYYQGSQKYTLRAKIVYYQKYGNEIRFNNKTFNSDDKALEDFYWTIGHILDCWNTGPAEAVFGIDNDGNYRGAELSTFYYSSTNSKGMQFVWTNDYDAEDNLYFLSVDRKYEANFKQVHIN